MLCKVQLRNEMKKRLANLKEEDYNLFSKQIKEKLIHTDEWEKAKTIGITYSLGNEVDTIAIIEEGWLQNKTIALPKCIPDQRLLNFYRVNSFEEVEDSFYSLKEPITAITPYIAKSDIDLLIVPGLIYDKRGYRIGFGGGYYDRYLVNYPGSTISLGFHFQIIDEVPNEAHDLPVKKIISNT